MKLDHIVIAVPDLAAAKAEFADRTGVEPIDGGPHASGGSCNALVAFAGGQYLEIIAPDPDQDVTGLRAERFAALPGPVVLHWAASETGLQQVVAAATAAGLDTSGVNPMERTTPAGVTLKWELCHVLGHGQGGCMPFFIDWLDTEHPSRTSPVVGALTSFTVSTPADSPIMKFPDPFPESATRTAGAPAITFEFESPRGSVRYHENDPAGFG